MDAILADFERLIVPAMTHWNHPGFMAYFANSAPPEGILGELLTAALNGNGMLWKTSPGDHRTGAGDAALAAAMERPARRLVRPDLRHGVHQQHARHRRRARGWPTRSRARAARGPAWWSTPPSSRTPRSRRAPSPSASGRTTCARFPWTPNSACGPTPCSELIEARPRRRPPPVLRHGHGGHHVHHQRRSGAGHRRYLRAAQHLAARGCGLRRFGGARAGVPLGIRRLRARRLAS